MPQGVGSLLGIITCNLLVDRVYIRLQKGHGDQPYPEARLPLVVAGGFLLPFTVALYGWSAERHWSVWILLLSVVLQGWALLACVVPIFTYVTDAFGLYSASALTAVLIARCLAGTFLPLLTAPLDEKVGYGRGFTILAAGCAVLTPIPVSKLESTDVTSAC